MNELEVIAALIAAIKAHAWYPVVGLAFTLVIALLRTVSPEKWAELPRWAKPIPAIVLSVLGAFVLVFEAGLPWELALGVGLYTLVGSVLVAVGAAETFGRFLPPRSPPNGDPKP